MEKAQKILNELTDEAESIGQNEKKLEELLSSVVQKAQRYRERLQDLWENLQLLIKMLDAYRKKEYRKVPWKAIIMIIAALLYFLNPMDIIPDFIPGIGFLDDATVLALVVRSIHEEIQNFKAYLATREQQA